MKISIKPKGYPKKDFEVEYMEDVSLKGIAFTVGDDEFILAGAFSKIQTRYDFAAPKYVGNMAPILPYLSQLYEEIKKHCITWLENPAEPFPWETEEEFKRNQ